ncbi:MAG: hypothetical protein AABM43_04470 [Actinomycetota bacterium]
MPLTDDQRAMLQLLLQRGQSYADIGSLLGLDVEGVQSRARAALTEIGGQDPDRDVSLTDYLLGQADPIGRADAARQLQADGEARDLAERLVIQLRVLAPGADLPDLPGADSGSAKRQDAPAPASQPFGEAAATAPKRRPFGELASTLSRGQRQAIAGLFGAGILIVVGVLALAGVFDSGGGGSSNATDSGGTTTARSGGTASNQGTVAQAALTPQSGTKAAGKAVLSFVRQGGQDVPAIQVIAVGLKRSPPGQSYYVWLYRNNSVALRLATQNVGRDGRLSGLATIPTAAYQALRNGTFDTIDVSLTSNKDYLQVVRQAQQANQLPPYTGESVLRGPITVGSRGSQSGQGNG